MKGEKIAKTMNALYGLVLAGGKSQRMGKDKGRIAYHGQPHSIYLFNLLSKVCEKTFLSIRQDQIEEYGDSYPIITDRDQFRGPFNGLMSAHESDPNASWLVVACDLPLIDLATIELLVRERDVTRIATTMATHSTGLPEPLVAIWEANGLSAAPAYLESSNSSCPRKYLINSNVKLVYPKDDSVLLNANSEEEYLQVIKKLSTA